ncbi:PhzF family phenazine biosynthesis protein [Pseudomonas citronellolis]|uniref:PhzF family phenazine biosynthesis protein n=1 Tax=Pseudomonas citronellolis TaxID=53408 RepID=A0AAW6PI12_9PSED|nr:PhzF family phenazine biosynthesis protein [Pseudomonas citronellolis]MDF3845943.1 PhzF family phenazine biosynthesis protein [Pseudomonas citronellolis]
MQLEFHQVDAFTHRPFAGNPAMVYRLDAWLADELMQNIAAEHNLSETAFLVREADGWRIRWFTPAAEVPLCGHATLASAHVLFEVFGEPGERLELNSLSGPLRVCREDQRLALDFPAQPPHEAGSTVELEQALGLPVVDALSTTAHLMVLLESEEAVRACKPDFVALAKLPYLGVIVTARGEGEHDFVSRFFAPAIGINEDPVTGAAHCCLIPYWSQRLSKLQLRALQCSARGGELWCRLEGDRVRIAGQARLVASGRLVI